MHVVQITACTVCFRLFSLLQNAHAIVNAAFNMEVDPATLQVTSIPLFVFGGIGTHVVGYTLNYLTNKWTMSLSCILL